MTGQRPQHHVLYRMFDRDGQLLYIGRSMSLPVRLADHQHRKEWWTAIARTDLEHHTSASDLATAEKRAIETEHPLYNVVHNGVPSFPVRELSQGDEEYDPDGALALPDPADRAAALQAIIARAEDAQRSAAPHLRAAVAELREAGHSHAEIGALLGVSRARAQDLANGRRGRTQ